jgi:hypothetical protein
VDDNDLAVVGHAERGRGDTSGLQPARGHELRFWNGERGIYRWRTWVGLGTQGSVLGRVQAFPCSK